MINDQCPAQAHREACTHQAKRPPAGRPETFAVHAVVPMKDLTRAKSRLSQHLSPAERRSLALNMLCNVLQVLCASSMQPELQAVWVVSSDPLVHAIAACCGARPLLDTTADLNGALELARAAVVEAGADALLVVPADTPLITSADVTGIIERLWQSDPPACVLVPNQQMSGTNALGLTLPATMPFQFGDDSFARHCNTAYNLGMHVRIFYSATLALDIDTPGDLARAWQLQTQQRRQRDDHYWVCCGT